MHLDFRPLLRKTFAELSRKYSYSQTPAISRGHQRKSKHHGSWRLALAEPAFWKLGCCIWTLFLETSKRIIRQWQRQVQGCASGPWCLAVPKPHLWKLGCYLWSIVKKHHHTNPHKKLNQNQTEILRCPSPAGPQAAVGGSPLRNDIMIIIPNFRETLAKKMLLSRTRKKLSRGLPITWTVFAIKTLYEDL